MKIPRAPIASANLPAVRYARQPTTLPGGGGGDIGAGLQDLAQSLNRMAEVDDRAYAAQAAAEAERHFSTRLVAAQNEAAEDGAGFTPQMDQEVKAWVEDRLANAPSPRARTFAAAQLDTLHSSVVSRALTFETTQRRTALGAKFDRAVDDLAVAAFNDPTSGARHIARAQAMPDEFDLLPGQRAQQRAAAPAKVAESVVKGIIATDPNAALKVLGAGTYDAFMDGEKKAQLTTAARVRMEALADQARQDAERAERKAEKLLRQQGDVAAKELNDLFADGKLSRESIDKRRGVLSPSEHQAYLKMLDPKTDDLPDRRDAVGRLEPMLGSADADREIDRAFTDGDLSISTYRSLKDRNRTLRSDDVPDSPRKTGRQFLSDALDPGQLGGDSITQQPLRIARARALAEWDDWIEANPNVTRAQARDQGEKMLERWQAVAFGDLRLALPRPYGFTGRKNDVADETITEATRTIERALAERRITQEQADREIANLRVWERAIQKTTKQPGAGK
jgi:hypothetical protein